MFLSRGGEFFVFTTKSLLRSDVLLVPLSNRSAA